MVVVDMMKSRHQKSYLSTEWWRPMHTDSKLLIASYLVIGLIATFIGMKFYQSQSRALQIEVPEQRKPVAVRTVVTREGSRALAQQIRRQREQIAELQRLVSKREEMLSKQSQELRQQTASTKKLDAEAERYFSVLIDLLNESTEDPSAFSDSVNSTSADVAQDLLAEQIEAEEQTPESMETELALTEWELDQLRSTEEETRIALEESNNRNSTLQQSLLATGEAAIPILINILANEDAELRTWAAAGLAQVGKASPVAMDALLVAADDDDAQVREAAATAIEQMSGG